MGLCKTKFWGRIFMIGPLMVVLVRFRWMQANQNKRPLWIEDVSLLRPLPLLIPRPPCQPVLPTYVIFRTARIRDPPPPLPPGLADRIPSNPRHWDTTTRGVEQVLGTLYSAQAITTSLCLGPAGGGGYLGLEGALVPLRGLQGGGG